MNTTSIKTQWMRLVDRKLEMILNREMPPGNELIDIVVYKDVAYVRVGKQENITAFREATVYRVTAL